MDLKLNRRKLSVCASSEMMRNLVPHQSFRRLNSLNYAGFCDSLKKMGKGVYIIGLDYHVGLIVNDEKNLWLIHSNYVDRKGVVKELVRDAWALKSSKTKWVASLTGDKELMERWLKGG